MGPSVSLPVCRASSRHLSPLSACSTASAPYPLASPHHHQRPTWQRPTCPEALPASIPSRTQALLQSSSTSLWISQPGHGGQGRGGGWGGGGSGLDWVWGGAATHYCSEQERQGTHTPHPVSWTGERCLPSTLPTPSQVPTAQVSGLNPTSHPTSPLPWQWAHLLLQGLEAW